MEKPPHDHRRADDRRVLFMLENVIIDIGSARNTGWSTDANDITLRNVSLRGPYAAVFSGDRVTWHGGEFGIAGQTGAPRVCGTDNEPITLWGANNVTIDGVRFHPQGADLTPSSCSSNGFHLEYIRVDGGGSNFTLRNSIFYNGDGSNTSTVFVTNPTSGGTYNGLKFENNMFGSNDASSGALAVHTNVASCANWTFAYNTYRAYPGAFGGGGMGCGTSSGWLWVGNVGGYAS